mgnify:FL=1
MKKVVNKNYIQLLDKIDLVEEKVYEIQDSLKILREVLLSSYDDVAGEEVCEDEIKANEAVYDAIGEICIESLLDLDPKGEA